jgi:hypothetical protein
MKKEGKKYINDLNLLRWPKSISNLGEAQIQSWSPAGGRTTHRGIVESLSELSSFREILTEKRNLMRELSETRSGPGPKANEWLAIEELIWVGWILVGLHHAQSSDIYIYILQHLTSRSLLTNWKILTASRLLKGGFVFTVTIILHLLDLQCSRWISTAVNQNKSFRNQHHQLTKAVRLPNKTKHAELIILEDSSHLISLRAAVHSPDLRVTTLERFE